MADSNVLPGYEALLEASGSLQEIALALGRFNGELLAAQPHTEFSRESVATQLQMNLVILFIHELAGGIVIDRLTSEDALMAAVADKRQLTPTESAIWEEARSKIERSRH